MAQFFTDDFADWSTDWTERYNTTPDWQAALSGGDVTIPGVASGDWTAHPWNDVEDGNHAEIVDALRRVGCVVMDISDLGRGLPDLVVGYRGEVIAIEVKNPQGWNRVSKSQREWMSKWPGRVAVVRSVDEALAVVTGAALAGEALGGDKPSATQGRTGLPGGLERATAPAPMETATRQRAPRGGRGTGRTRRECPRPE